MARLNTHLSATPQQTRSSTVDSLYRDPSVAPRNVSNARGSTYSVMSPSQSSDKENMGSDSCEETPQPAKRRGLSSASGRIPTPDSGSTSSASNKRRRTGDYSMNGASDIYEDEDEDGDEDVEEADAQDSTQPEENEDEDDHSKLYNPKQNPEIRRQVRYQLRDNHRQLEENRTELIKAKNSGLYHLIKKNDATFKKVRQTADAAVDSRFLITATDLASKKLEQSLHGSGGAGIDLDKFVSKCIYFMKSGGYRHGDEDAPAIARHLEAAAEAASDELGQLEDVTDEDQSAAFARHRVAITPDDEPAVSLFDFAINPHDFGQTVENLFYISFLVREGNAQIVKDADGLPLLAPAAPRGVSEQQEQGAQKHQAIFSIDYPTWQTFTQAYDIKEPLIPHRVQEDENGGSRWY
ncbi:Nse4-domain-containing protein [Lizonia empirigonia]|nr:Nse4-domain-containing protein [Lizonia empirigonia]